ncbi:MAG: 16S rRNA (uracil(1498)-N(3))-methyltransferase [Moraxellaceae bacterium]|nr:16S rRNA (uracil(1498)-N(3))-methyltransferase [Moraxellaceae bacterium]
MRFYIPLPLSAGTDISLPDEASHHLLRVLRAQVGDSFVLFNGDGGEFDATLTEAGKKSARVHIGTFRPDDRESPLHTHLGQVMSRGERMDYAIQKATELGVSVITPLTSERCELKLRGEERADKKLEHWRRIAIAACEQCGRNRLPVIHAPQSLAEWLASSSASLRLVLAPTAGDALPASRDTTSAALLIGPEGGLSAAEIAGAQAAGFLCWQIGPRVFRTETAPVAALALLQARFGDFR